MEPYIPPKRGLHTGHRSRMRQRFLQNGLENFADHEVLELLLFYAIPRRDVNPTAHMLLDRFGSLPGVLDAPKEELRAIPGVGPKVARFLTLIPDILYQMQSCLLCQDHPLLCSSGALLDLMRRRHSSPCPGDVFLILLDRHYASLAVYPYATFDELDVREVALLALRSGSRLVALAECVQDPDAPLGSHRAETLSALHTALSALDIRLMDYYRFDPLCTRVSPTAATGLLLPK